MLEFAKNTECFRAGADQVNDSIDVHPLFHHISRYLSSEIIDSVILDLIDKK